MLTHLVILFMAECIVRVIKLVRIGNSKKYSGEYSISP